MEGEFCMRVKERERERERDEERATRFFGGKNKETLDTHYEDSSSVAALTMW